VLDGLRAAGAVDSVGVDSWGVDYGLLDADGRLLGNPVHYRDPRTATVMERIVAQLSAEKLYATTGLQLQPFNTIFQLAAARSDAVWPAARTMLLMPDLITYWLTDVMGAERTNASTTQLLDVTTGAWATDLTGRLGLPPDLLPALREPGSIVGDLLASVVAECGLERPVPVVAVGSHDTASAVVGVPAAGERFAYISCGTWSLVGVELTRPVLTAASREANFTNEVGVDGTIRYLRNVMGLWLLQECLRAWRDAGHSVELEPLLREAGRLPALAAVVDAGDPEFLAPGDMPGRIGAACERLGQRRPASPAAIVRCIVDSLALAHRAAVLDAQRLSGHEVEVVHIVGGGARNELLCQLTADACGLPVLAGPQEATALGNALVQARALGRIGHDLASARALIRATHPPRRYEPEGDARAWATTAARPAS
jgi:rhamnulokinase